MDLSNFVSLDQVSTIFLCVLFMLLHSLLEMKQVDAVNQAQTKNGIECKWSKCKLVMQTHAQAGRQAEMHTRTQMQKDSGAGGGDF